MLHQALSYFLFLLRSKNQHGVHSPFVFDLITKCFYDKTPYKSYGTIKNYRKVLLSNNNSILVNDLGRGSRILKNQKRSISSITRNSGTTESRAQLMYRIVNYFQFKSILELGTSLGIATHAMHLGNANAAITTVEGCTNISEFSKAQFQHLHPNNINVLKGNFKEVIKTLSSNSYDLVFFDGNHQKEATLGYFETLLNTAHNDSVFIFDDIYWSKGMTEAWKIIVKHPKVTVSIDTFYWGFVFFRKEQQKEHFTIRI